MLKQLAGGVFVIALAIGTSIVAHSAPRKSDPNAPRRWTVETMRNGKWAKSGVFDTRDEAQAKLDNQRKRSARSGPIVGRVVPTDWERWENLGSLSAKYESGTRGSATVSTGIGDRGGVSYGTYQLASKVGTAQRFVAQYYADWFQGTEPGSEEFSALWRQLAEERGPELAVYEHLFIIDTHYQPFADRLRKELNLDVDQHSNALRDVAWSTSVQHGAGNKMFHRALEKAAQENPLDQITDHEIIELVYQERGRVDANGIPIYFTKSSPQVQKGVLNRFKNEAQDALKQLAAEPPMRKPRR